MISSRDHKQIRRLVNATVCCPTDLAVFCIADQDLALRLARRVRLHGRLAAKLCETSAFEKLPLEARDQLDSALVMAESRARVANWELDRVAWAIKGNDEVPLVAMKGCAYLLLGLPNTAGRIFADVDLLLPEAELGRVEEILNQRGWETNELTPYDQNYYRRWTHELPPMIHEEREVEIDLHHNIMPRTARLNPSSAKLLERSRQLPNSRYRVLANEDIVLHAMAHLMFDADLADKLRDLVDIADLLNHFSDGDNDFWVKLVDRAVELDLTRPFYYSIRYVNQLLEMSIPKNVLTRSQVWSPPGPIVWLMDRAVPRALYPQHPDHPSKLSAFLRLLLYIRSHWIRMPPWLLAYHLTYKFVVTRLWRQQPV